MLLHELNTCWKTCDVVVPMQCCSGYHLEVPSRTPADKSGDTIFWKGVLSETCTWRLVVIEFLAVLTCFFSFGGTARNAPDTPHSRGFLITHNDAQQSVGLLWTSDRPDAEPSPWQHTTLTTDRHPCPPVGFEPTISASERPHINALEQRGHWDRLINMLQSDYNLILLFSWRYNPSWLYFSQTRSGL